jgi:predicted AAA+ superfamily ATPase
MYREIMDDLIRWKTKIRRKPLLITGVRQCGKTFIIEEFGKNRFEGFVKLDFERSEKAGAIFDYDFDVNRIISEIEFLEGEKIIPGKTLLFFDEVQNCPRAIAALSTSAKT